MDAQQKNNLANDWIEYTNLSIELGLTNPKVESLSSSSEALNDLIQTSPELALEIILRILELDQTPQIIGNLSAGPLEDFLVYNGEKYIDEIQQIAMRNQKFAKLLGGVWQNQISNTVWVKIQSVSDRSGLD